MPPRRYGELRQREHPRGPRRHGRKDQGLGGADLHLDDRRGDRRNGRPQRLRLLYEAILATLAIIVWHLYYVFVNPDFAPMSFTWIDGKLSRHDMEHEHALELEEIETYGRRGDTPPPDVTRIAPEEE